MPDSTLIEVASTLTPRQAFRLLPLYVVATVNPKKRPSMSYDRFNNYFTLDCAAGVTVQDALDAGVRMDDIRHDTEHGFIKVGDEAEALATAAFEAREAAAAEAKKIAQREARAAKRKAK